jgi:hypothetical protein
MLETEESVTAACVNHPRQETAVRCGKCAKPICTRCMVSTPVGMRCRECAQLRRLPQFDVGPNLLVRAVPAGLAASTLAWFIVAYIPFFRFFLGILVGAAVGEVMSRLARRRSNVVLEASAVMAVVAGFFAAVALHDPGAAGADIAGIATNTGLQLGVLLPLVLASIVAVVKLR